MIFGVISGGHFNPAVTLGVLVREGHHHFKHHWHFAAMIIGSQIIGAAIGVMIAWVGMYQVGKGSGLETYFPAAAILCPPGELTSYPDC